MTLLAVALMQSLLVATPPGAVSIPLPRHPSGAATGFGDARGRCAIFESIQFRFVAMTADEGRTWRFARSSHSLHGPTDWPRFYCDGDAFFAVTANGAIARPSGDDWKIAPPIGPRESSYHGLESVAGVLYLGTGWRTWTSSDRGASWRPWRAGIGALATDGKSVFAAVGRQVSRAAPGAADIAPVGKLPEEVTALGFDAGTLYAGTTEGVYRSRDGGASWTKVRPPPQRALPPSRFTFANGSVFVEGGRVDVLQPGDAWSHREDCWAILPTATGFWLRLSNGFAYVRTLADKPEPRVWPDNPFPTVEAVGTRGSTLLVSVRSVAGVFVSADGGHRWQHLCQIFGADTGIAIDGDRLQLRPNSSGRDHACPVSGLKTRVVAELPQESCNGALCVRWRDGRLARTRNRGGSWDDLTDRLPSNAWRDRIVLGAAAGREILIGIDREFPLQPSRLDEGLELWRSVDDGTTFARWDAGEMVSAFAPGPEGWYLGTVFRGLLRVPFAAKAP
jgi:hypothetical protein